MAKGGLVQLVEDLGTVKPNILVFQYNPEKLTIVVKPWEPFAAKPEGETKDALIQPFTPDATYSFDIHFDATDAIVAGDPAADQFGVGPQIAALRKLLEPSNGLLSDLVGAAEALVGGVVDQVAVRKTVPLLLLVLGTTVLPVRVTKYSCVIDDFIPSLEPLRATVTLEMQVLTPEMLSNNKTAAAKLAIGAYDFTRLRDNTLAVSSAMASATSAPSLLPFP